MKRYFLTIITLLFLVQLGFSQSSQTVTPEQTTVVVNTEDLTPDQLAKIKAKQELENLQKRLDTYGDWVGVGGEIGNGIKEALNAVVDVSDKFGKTNVGKFTMVLVAWKIIGKDIVRILLGIIFIILFSTFVYKTLRKMYPYKITTKDNGWKIWLTKEYKIIEPHTYEGYEVVKFVYVVLLAAGFGITYAIMFA